MVSITPRMFAGHGMPCPYQCKGKRAQQPYAETAPGKAAPYKGKGESKSSAPTNAKSKGAGNPYAETTQGKTAPLQRQKQKQRRGSPTCQVRGPRRGRRTSRSRFVSSIPVAASLRLISEPEFRRMQRRTHSMLRMGVEVAPDLSWNGVMRSALFSTDSISAEGLRELSAALPFFDLRSLCQTLLSVSPRFV